MRFLRASKVRTDSFFQLLRGQQAVGFHHTPLAMPPARLHRIQPRTFRGQGTDQNPHALTRLLDRSVGRFDPLPHRLTDMPGRIVPDQPPHPFAPSRQLLTAKVQKLRRDPAHTTPLNKPQPDLFRQGGGRRGTTDQPPIARHCLGVLVLFVHRLFHQTQRMPPLAPRRPSGALPTAPPSFILKSQRPIGLRLCPTPQAIPAVFFVGMRGQDCWSSAWHAASAVPTPAKKPEWSPR